MQDRETIRLLAYGQYAFTHRDASIEVSEMEVFVQGALWAYDFSNKKQADIKYLNAMHIGNQIESHTPVDVDSMV